MKTPFYILLLLLLATSGCSKSEFSSRTVKIAPTITRVTGLHFDSGDRIGLTITKGSDVYAQNVLMTFDGANFSTDALSWYTDGQKSTLTAFYPYSSQGMPDEFTVLQDQTSGNTTSDPLVAIKTDVSPSSAPVGMVFHHILSQLTIIVTNNSSTNIKGVSVSGSISTAEIDYIQTSASAKSGVAPTTIKAYESSAGSIYRVILVPQQAALTLDVETADGKSRSKTIPSAQLSSGKSYDVSVVVTDEQIEVKLSGDIADWDDGGSIDEGGSEEGDGTLTYGGITYKTATFGGKVWMDENLRNVPDGLLLGDGIWYPSSMGTEVTSEEQVKKLGMLYSFAKVSVTTFASDEPLRGICPSGWHIPTITELSALVASSEFKAPQLVCPGMWNAGSKLYTTTSRCYLMSCTSNVEESEYQTLVFDEGGSNPTVIPVSSSNGISLRCTKD